jgi:hypothetical protein
VALLYPDLEEVQAQQQAEVLKISSAFDRESLRKQREEGTGLCFLVLVLFLCA